MDWVQSLGQGTEIMQDKLHAPTPQKKDSNIAFMVSQFRSDRKWDFPYDFLNSSSALYFHHFEMGYAGEGASQAAVKNPPANAGDVRDRGSIPRWGRSPGGGHGNPLQYSCLEKLMDTQPWGCKESDTTEAT